MQLQSYHAFIDLKDFLIFFLKMSFDKNNA